MSEETSRCRGEDDHQIISMRQSKKTSMIAGTTKTGFRAVIIKNGRMAAEKKNKTKTKALCTILWVT